MTGAAPPSLTILVPTIGQREALFMRLMGALLPQLDEWGGRARVLAWRNNGHPPLCDIRDGMLAAADTSHVAFIDDDDLVPEYYVGEIMRALNEDPDHVGFKIEYHENGRMREVVEHSLKWHGWGRSVEGVLYRDFTHIDPVRLDLARRGSFFVPRRGRAEDRTWVKSIRGLLATEVYIDKIMYQYLWDSQISAWQRPERILPSVGRPPIAHPYFAWHERSDS